VSTYLSVVDETFTACGLRPPSDHLDAFLFCRAVSLCAHRHRDDDVWRHRRGILDAAVRAHAMRGDMPVRLRLRQPQPGQPRPSPRSTR
jgi:hypothetical protein